MPVVVRYACVHVLRLVASAPAGAAASLLRKKHCTTAALA